ncbi:MAG: hypothetical protein OK422_01635 [Thaumarchaeota archaeon]|nr:hypothetical protein [Nitrososphaerota archaeon]
MTAVPRYSSGIFFGYTEEFVRELEAMAYGKTLHYRTLGLLAQDEEPLSLETLREDLALGRRAILYHETGRAGILREIIEQFVINGLVERVGNPYRTKYKLNLDNGYRWALFRLQRDNPRLDRR